MPVGELDPVFVRNADREKADLANNVTATRAAGVCRVWVLGVVAYPSDVDADPLWNGDVLDPVEIGKNFNRDGIAEDYNRAITDGKGSTGDAMSSKVQSDLLAAKERAFRLRHSTPIRRALHAAARRLGQTTEAVGLHDRVRNYCQDLIVAGGKGFIEEEPEEEEGEEESP